MNEHSPDNLDDLRELMAAYETPAPSGDFADETLLRIALHRHDPGLRVGDTDAGFADRVVAAAMADRAGAPLGGAASTEHTRAAFLGTSDAAPSDESSAPARAPAPIEMRSRLAPYLLVAVLLIATTIALIWPKGPGETMPGVRALATELESAIRDSTDPASIVGSLVPVSAFATPVATTPVSERYEIPRFSPPNLAEFQAADLATRSIAPEDTTR